MEQMAVGLDLLLGGVGAALLAEADDGSDEAAVVLHALVGTAARLLFFILFRHLGRLPPHLPRAGKRSVHLTCRELNAQNGDSYTTVTRVENEKIRGSLPMAAAAELGC